jgi:hypothetical protein
VLEHCPKLGKALLRALEDKSEACREASAAVLTLLLQVWVSSMYAPSPPTGNVFDSLVRVQTRSEDAML